MLWARGKRAERILAATDALVAAGRRWQSAIKIDPEQYTRTQGLQTGQPVLRVGLGPDIDKLQTDLLRTVSAMAATRALPYLDPGQREAVTLHSWTEGLNPGPPRWGGAYSNLAPDAQVAAPVDGEVWKYLRDDPIAGRDALTQLKDLVAATMGASSEPLLPVFMTAMMIGNDPFPQQWTTEPFAPIKVLAGETLAALIRADAGGDAGAVLLAEYVAHRLAPSHVLPAGVAEQVREEARPWRTRATPPRQLVDTWQEETLAKLPGDVLEQAYSDYLKDQAVRLTLDALIRRQSAVALESEPFWQATGGDLQALPVFALLARTDAEQHAHVLDEIEQHSGRFKSKQRRQIGAGFLAQVAFLDVFDQWLAKFFKENTALLEISRDDPARLAEESERGGLYAFSSELAPTSANESYAAFDTGHLFADLKGFTELTAQLHESEIRQFLRQSFYEPLLRIAKDYFKGGTDLADRGGIRLNNLMGDAISICGDPADLLRFSERATTFVQDGMGELIKQAGIGQAAEEDMARRAGIEQQLRDLRLQKARGEGDGAALEAQIRTLQQSLQGSEGKNKSAIELDFGFFVSYGAAPVDLTLEDDMFGNVYVALAEKINESARGVARDGDVFAAMQKFEERFSGRPWAFRIHAGPSFIGEMPDIMLDGWPTEPEEADVLARGMPGGLSFAGTTGMYNVGIGLSPETVSAVLRQGSSAEVTFWQGKTADLVSRLDRRYLMPEPRQTFIVLDWDDDETRILRRCGKVHMKGFKMPPTVWEWVGPWMDVYTSLHNHIENNGKKMPWAQALQHAH